MKLNLFHPLLICVIVFSCQTKKDIIPLNKQIKQDTAMEIKVKSNAFEQGGMIPKKYTCDGEDISPQLSWSDIPSNTKSIALINDDPDAPAGTWVHWVIYNIPGGEKGLPEAVPVKKNLDNGAVQGKNDFGNIGYGGPCPPGGTHRYYFKLYALDTALSLQGDVTKGQLLEAMKGHILAEGQLMGKYSRSG
jgi:Raf kinase inhibitor-like YbhB/YbcL family protein